MITQKKCLRLLPGLLMGVALVSTPAWADTDDTNTAPDAQDEPHAFDADASSLDQEAAGSELEFAPPGRGGGRGGWDRGDRGRRDGGWDRGGWGRGGWGRGGWGRGGWGGGGWGGGGGGWGGGGGGGGGGAVCSWDNYNSTGWSWENGQACRVNPERFPWCQNRYDEDGDGFGWEGNQACRLY